MPKPIQILLAEDDDGDALITRRAIKRSAFPVEIVVVGDGQEALDFLQAPQNPLPDLLLLDIHLPKVSGLEVLRAVKTDPGLRAIPCLILTASARQEDVNIAYTYGANGFLCKPLRFADFVELLRSMSRYWSSVARLPGRDP